MRGILNIAAAGIVAFAALPFAPLQAEDRIGPKGEVRLAVWSFFEALRSTDKTALADTMLNEAVIFIHDRRNPEAPVMRIVPAGEHLKAWERTPQGTDEYMEIDSLLIDGRMAHVWGPYVFLLNGQPTHCGINSMSLARTEDGWRVANTSFTMTALDECKSLGAPEVPSK